MWRTRENIVVPWDTTFTWFRLDLIRRCRWSVIHHLVLCLQLRLDGGYVCPLDLGNDTLKLLCARWCSANGVAVKFGIMKLLLEWKWLWRSRNIDWKLTNNNDCPLVRQGFPPFQFKHIQEVSPTFFPFAGVPQWGQPPLRKHRRLELYYICRKYCQEFIWSTLNWTRWLRKGDMRRQACSPSCWPRCRQLQKEWNSVGGPSSSSSWSARKERKHPFSHQWINKQADTK